MRTRSLASAKVWDTSSHHRFAGTIRPSLHDGVTAYSALSLVIGLSCHHPRCNASACHPVNASVEASRPHGFAVRDRAARLAVHSRPSHPALHVRDDAQRPSDERETREELSLICPTGQVGFRVASFDPSADVSRAPAPASCRIAESSAPAANDSVSGNRGRPVIGEFGGRW